MSRPEDAAIWVYALQRCRRGARLTSAERVTLARLMGAHRELEPAWGRAAPQVLAEVERLEGAHAADPFAPVASLRLREAPARRLLQAACDFALSDGELTLEQNMRLDELREHLELGEDELAALIDDRMLARLRPPEPPFGGAKMLTGLNAPLNLTKVDPSFWRSVPRDAQVHALDAARFWRGLGFFTEQRDWSEVELAAALERYRASTYATPPGASDWDYLTADRARVWTVDFTGNDNGPAWGVAAALEQLGRISAGEFAPSKIKVKSAGRTVSVEFQVSGQILRFGGLIRSPIHFDLTLLERLDEAVPHLSFCVGVFEDDHHLVVVKRKLLAKLRRRKLTLYAGQQFEEFRRWASGQRDV
jgi:hypothetical protein